MRKQKTSNSTFAICLFVSLIFHLGGIFFIQKYSLWFTSSKSSSTNHTAQLEKVKKQQILRQVTDHIQQVRPKIDYFPKGELDQQFVSAFTLSIETKQTTHSIKPIDFQPPKWENQESLQESTLLTIAASPSNVIDDIRSMTQKASLKPNPTPTPTNVFNPTEEEAHLSYTFQKAVAKIEPIQAEKVRIKAETPPPAFLVRSDPTSPSQKIIKPTYSSIPTLDRMNTFLYADDFDIEITSTINEKEPGYIFAVTLIPKIDIDLETINQNFFFLIDRSNPIQKERLKASRDAVYRSLSFLKKEDTFNILAFDSKIEKLFVEQKKITTSLKDRAKKFLINQKLASFFVSPNIYNCLYAVSNQEKDDDRINTIILLSNGDGLRHKALQHHFMKQWSSLNYKKASLFSIAMAHDPYITDLELISVLNRGWLMSSTTKGGIKRKLIKLMKTIQRPILKDVACHAVSKRSDHLIDLFKPFKQLPHLYANEPYTVIGKCEKLEDFTLILQGKNKNKWINIKKHIPLSNAQEGGESLKEQWALHEAWKAYREYLNDANTKHLQYAEKILEAFDIPPAFQ